MSAVDNENFLDVPGVAILPLGKSFYKLKNLFIFKINQYNKIVLGTGNELSRVVGWGTTYDDESIETFIEKVKKGKLIGIDRYLLINQFIHTFFI